MCFLLPSARDGASRGMYPFTPVIDQAFCGGIQGFPARASSGWMLWLRAVPRCGIRTCDRRMRSKIF